MYQLNTNKLPKIIQSIFLKLSNLHEHDTRQSKITNLFVPRVSKKIARNQLSFRGPSSGYQSHQKLKLYLENHLKKYIKTSFLKIIENSVVLLPIILR